MKYTFVRRISALLLVLGLLASAGLPVYAADGVRLRWWSAEETLPFTVTNMFPGDSVTKEYTVEVSHSKALVLHYTAQVLAGSEKLAEVLMVKVSLPDKGVTLYEGLMRDMPASLDHTLAANETTLNYKITAWLDTSVGNEYMNKTLTADFRWWYQPETATPRTGDDAPVALYAGLLGVSAAALVVLVILLKKKKESHDEND